MALRRLLLGLCFTMLYSSLAGSSMPANSPNIILVVADDLGYNDVGFHGSEIFTPNLDKLANTGVMLENYYVSPSCSPSRSQLLTGRYGIHTGLVRNIQPMEPSCLRLDEVTLAEKLKARDYKTHLVGKWHLGHYKQECAPTQRGFDSFYGILLGSGDHFRYYKRKRIRGKIHHGYDFWHNNSVSYDEGHLRKYSTTMYGEKALEIISQHNPKYPLFMYLSFQAPHAPLQVTRDWLKQNGGIRDLTRRYLAGMVTALDSAVGKLVNKLQSRNMWENSVLVFTTDNGGQMLSGGSNWPLRGGKGSFWEGGVRGVGFVNSPLIKRPGRRSRKLIHISDWFPTFVHLSGGDLNGSKPLDGANQWDTISRGAASPRKEVLLGLWPGLADQTMRKGRVNKQCRKHIPKTLLRCEKKKLFPKSPKKCPSKKSIKKLCLTYNGSKWCNRAAIRRGKWKLLVGVQKPGNWIPARGSGQNVICSSEHENSKRLQLFNVRKDPNEKTDVAEMYPEKVAWLMRRLEIHRKRSIGKPAKRSDMRGSPENNGGIWGPWMSLKIAIV